MEKYKEYKKNWYQNNKEIIKARSKNRYLLNKEEILKQIKEYRTKNAKYISKRAKKYRQKRKEHISIINKIYNIKNKDIIRVKNRDYYIKNRESIINKVKKYTENNKEQHSKYAHEYYLKNKEDIAKYHKEYRKEHYEDIIVPRRKKNRSKINATMRKYRAKRIKIDVNYKLSINLRNRLLQAIKRNQKMGSAINDLGCTIFELKKYLEKQFTGNMSWKNYGRKGWHIDHIKPLSSFDLINREQFLKACHYTNLQPLWAKDNLIKHNKII